jgi:hypothetical protein
LKNEIDRRAVEILIRSRKAMLRLSTLKPLKTSTSKATLVVFLHPMDSLPEMEALRMIGAQSAQQYESFAQCLNHIRMKIFMSTFSLIPKALNLPH